MTRRLLVAAPLAVGGWLLLQAPTLAHFTVLRPVTVPSSAESPYLVCNRAMTECRKAEQ